MVPSTKVLEGRFLGPKLEASVQTGTVSVGPVFSVVLQQSILDGLRVLRYGWRAKEGMGASAAVSWLGG